MAFLKSFVLFFLSINFFSENFAQSVSSPRLLANSSDIEQFAHLNKVKFNKTKVFESNLSVLKQLSNSTERTELSPVLNGVDLNVTENKLQVLNSKNISENFHEFNASTLEFSDGEESDSSEVPNNTSVIHGVLVNTNSDQDYSAENNTIEDWEGPLLRFDDNETIDYTVDESEGHSLLSLLFNELRVSSDQDMTPDQKFVKLVIKIRKLFDLVKKDLTPLLIEKIITTNISLECINGLSKVYSALNTNQQWVFKMLDANGHFPSGLMSGTLTSLGDYDQCLSVEDLEYDIRGQYCLLKVKSELPKKKKIITFKDRFINLNGTELHNTWIDKHIVKNLYNFYYFSITNGICIPSVCSQTDLVTIARKFLGSFHLQVDVENCASKSDTPVQLNNGQTIAVMIILVFVSASSLSTVFHIILVTNSHKYRNIFTQIIECFSLRENIRKFFDTSSDSHKSHTYNLQFIDGMKVLSMYWVIIGHTYISGAIFFNKDIPTANFYFDNLVDTLNLPKQVFTQFVFNGLLAVDTFFFISGFLVVYLAVTKIVQENQKINFTFYVFLRWIRFTPMLLAIISMNLLWPLMGSGPLFHQNYIKFMTDPCYKYWWRNLLFISNWYPTQEQCMVHTWYMSADFQYYIMAFFVIKLTSSNIKNGMMACLGLVLLGIVIQTLVAFNNNLPPTILYQADIENMDLHTSLMHYKTYNHLTPYFLGAFVACLLLKKTKNYVNKWIRLIFWVYTFIGSLFVIFISYVWTNLEWEYTRVEAALYFGSHRFIWSTGLSWLTWNCAQNRGGVINSILSSSIFKLTSRLTFSIYLSHMLILWFNFFRIRHLLSSTHYDFLFTFAGVFVFTLVLAFFNHIIFELPVINLVKFIISSKRYTDKNSNQIIDKNICYKNNNENSKVII